MDILTFKTVLVAEDDDFMRRVMVAVMTRLGGRVGSTQMRLVNEDGLLIATGAASYILA